MLSRSQTLHKKYRDNHLFGGNREIAIQRDGEKCVSCGMTRKEHRAKYGYDITVDHIDGKGCRTPLGLKNNNLDNLQTLCSSCHCRKDIRRGYKPKHDRHGQSKITLETARFLRGLEEIDARNMAEQLGINRDTIYLLRSNQTWKEDL